MIDMYIYGDYLCTVIIFILISIICLIILLNLDKFSTLLENIIGGVSVNVIAGSFASFEEKISNKLKKKDKKKTI